MTVSTSGEVLEGLHRIRIRRRIMWAMMLAYLPVVILISLSGFPHLASLIAAVWLAMIAATSMLAMFSRCPRCNDFFHTRILWGSLWRTKCINCGLPLGK